MSQMPSTDKLSELWFNRQTLNEQQWTELYQLVYSALHTYKPAILKSLSLEHEDYIQQFFMEKVLLKTCANKTGSIHAGAIRDFYNRFLISQSRSANEKRNQQTESSDHEDFVEKSKPQSSTETMQDDAQILLHDYGWSEQQFIEQTRLFYKNLETWAQQYLSLHFCPDAQEALPLNALAQRYKISSYHYKAGLLGITRKKTDSAQNYHKTLLGNWLSNTLKIQCDHENQNIIALVLKILCITALST